MRATLALFVVLALSASQIGSAQTGPQPTRLENVQYYKVEYHRFKPGKAAEGRAFMAGGADEATKLDKEFDNLVQEVRIEIMLRDVEK